MTVKRMDNVSIVVQDIDDTLARLGKRGARSGSPSSSDSRLPERIP
jgi:hypothetical protein